MKRPKVIVSCGADACHANGERIVEVSFPDGSGCLVSIGSGDARGNRIEIYRRDPSIDVIVGK